MQLAMTLYFWLLLRFLPTLLWIFRFKRFFETTVLRKRSTNGKAYGFWNREQIDSFLKKQIAILRSALVEFQEAQLFFVIATQIGIITVLSFRLGTFDSYSTTELDSNNHFLLLIDATGIYTISLLLLVL